MPALRHTSTLPRVAIIGRTNVGKSTLWNRLTSSTQALTSNEPHTTRDRNYGLVTWQGVSFELIDTGGLDVEKNEVGRGIQEQSALAMHDADLVLFVVDSKIGLVPEDQLILKQARAIKKPIWLIANKCDRRDHIARANDLAFFQLGLGNPFPVSATTSFGIGDLLDKVLAFLEEIKKPARPVQETQPIRIALVGRPNVGKSSLTNAILGENRVIVSPMAHTTREPQDTAFEYKERELILVDTAGMRKRSKVEAGLEEAGVGRNEQAISNADVALLVFDASEDPTAQDRHLAGVLQETSKGLILVANKWDLVEGKVTETMQKYEDLIRQNLPFLSWAPMVFVSALTGQRTQQLLDKALEVQSERYRHIDYNAINKLLKSTIKAMKPLASYGPKSPRIYDVAQIDSAPPTFLITVFGEKESIHHNWTKFFQKRLREKFGFIGTPIIVKVRNIPVAKSNRKRNIQGPGMAAVAGEIKEKPRLVNQTRRRQKWG